MLAGVVPDGRELCRPSAPVCTAAAWPYAGGLGGGSMLTTGRYVGHASQQQQAFGQSKSAAWPAPLCRCVEVWRLCVTDALLAIPAHFTTARCPGRAAAACLLVLMHSVM